MVKFEDDDIVLKELEGLARREKIKTAVFVFLGALKKGRLVTGPKKPVIPPAPNWTAFKDGWEVLGCGTLLTHAGSPQLHVHAAMGKKHKVLAGCIRKDTKVFLVLEAVIFELKNIKATKSLDPRTGINLLRFLS